MKKSILVILTLVVCFCVFYGVRYIENPVETLTAKSETYENKIEIAGYIVRNEQVYNAPASGAVYHYIQEGTRVSKNRVLSTVYTGDVSEEKLSELNNINQKIADMEAGLNSDTAYMAGGVNSEENIEHIKNNIIKARTSGKISKIASYKAQINSIVTGNAETVEAESIDNLKIRKAEIEASLRSNKNDIYSQMSGVFSKNVDGLESVLTPKEIMTYTLADYNNIKAIALEKGTALAEGQPVCKVVNNHEWYVMLTVESQVAESLKTGKSVKLRFDSLPGIEAKAEISYISNEATGTDRRVVVLKSEEYKEGVFSIRSSKIELILESYEGFKVPIYALHVDGDQKGVYVKDGAIEIFKPCKVIYTDTKSETVIITPISGTDMLNENDQILIGEK